MIKSIIEWFRVKKSFKVMRYLQKDRNRAERIILLAFGEHLQKYPQKRKKGE